MAAHSVPLLLKLYRMGEWLLLDYICPFIFGEQGLELGGPLGHPMGLATPEDHSKPQSGCLSI